MINAARKTVNVRGSAVDLSLPSLALDEYAFSRSGLFVPERLARRPVAIDLFCGAGGFSLGFMQAGFEVIAGLEYDAIPAITYLYNLGSYPVNMHWIEPGDKERFNKEIEREAARAKKETGIYTMPTSGGNTAMKECGYPPVTHFFFGDVRKITGQEILDAIGLKQGEVDCVMGGPPCQGFSTAGRRDVADPRNNLVFEFARLVLEIRPKTMVMENVPGMLRMVTPEGIPVVDALCRILEKGGFGTLDALKKGLLASAGCGAAMKSGKRPKGAKDVDENGLEDDDTGQLSLFEEATL